MESRAPVSRVARARARVLGGVVGVGSRALRCSSSRLAAESCCCVWAAGRSLEERRWWRIVSRLWVDMVVSLMVVVVVVVEGCDGGAAGSCWEGGGGDGGGVWKAMMSKLSRRALIMPRLKARAWKVCRPMICRMVAANDESVDWWGMLMDFLSEYGAARGGGCRFVLYMPRELQEL